MTNTLIDTLISTNTLDSSRINIEYKQTLAAKIQQYQDFINYLEESEGNHD